MDLVVVGDIGLDHAVVLEETNAPDEKIAVIDAAWSVGGTGANVALQAQKLGVHTRLYSTIGTDFAGQYLMSECSRIGLDTSGIEVSAGRTMTATIVVKGEERRVLVDLGNSMSVVFPPNAFPSTALIYVTLNSPQACSLVDSGLGPRTVLGFEHWMSSHQELVDRLSRLRAIITNSAGWQALSTLSPARLPACVVVTRGGQGVELRGSHAGRVPPLHVEVRDATGAGDSFAGAWCAAIAQGFGEIEATWRANQVAALSTTKLGANAGQPTTADLGEQLAHPKMQLIPIEDPCDWNSLG